MLLQNSKLKVMRRRRSRRQAKRIFFTGVTGFLGQFLAIKLLKASHFLLFLAREKGGLTAEERVSSALAFADIDTYTNYQHRFSVVEGDLDNLPKNIETDEIYHLAGSTSFAEPERDEIFQANLQGTKNVLELAKKIRPSALHYISTAYVCNSAQPIAYETPANCFTTVQNPYAESKCLAEQAVLEFGEKNPGCKVFIYRPSIIVGRSWDGLTSNFFGYYRYMQTLFRLGNAIIKKNGFKDEVINLPIWVPGDPETDINIVTIDHVVDMMARIRKENVPGIYHLANPSPPTYGWLLEESLRVLNISGPSPLQDPAETPGNLRKLEIRIAKGVEEYIPFITSRTRFDMSRSRYVLGYNYRSQSVITSEVVRTLLKFAIHCEFKKEKALDPKLNIVFGKYSSPLPAISLPTGMHTRT